MAPTRKRLGDILLEMGAVDALQLRAALGHHQQWGMPLGRTLVERRICSVTQVLAALSRQTGLSTVDLDSLDLSTAPLQLVPRWLAERHRMIPLSVEGSRNEVLVVAAAAPVALSDLDAVQSAAGKIRMRPLLAADDALERAIARLYGGPGSETPQPGPALLTPISPAPQPANERVLDLELGADDGTVFEFDHEDGRPTPMPEAARFGRPSEQGRFTPAPDPGRFTPTPDPGRFTATPDPGRFTPVPESQSPSPAGRFTPVPASGSPSPAPGRFTPPPDLGRSTPAPRPRPPAPTTPPPPPGRVLLFGWSEDVTLALAAALAEAGVKAQAVPDEVVLAAARDDVVISSTLALETLLAPGERLAPRVIICGAPDASDMEAAKSLGARVYLPPPFSVIQLETAVARCHEAAARRRRR